MTTYIYGASDDLIEFEGDVYDEFDVYRKAAFKLTHNDGTQLTISWELMNSGDWRFTSDLSDEELRELGYVIERLPENWDIDMENDLGYSDVLIAPDGLKSAQVDTK